MCWWFLTRLSPLLLSNNQFLNTTTHPHVHMFLLEVVFAVGGDTNSAEWLDTEAGEKPVCLDPLVENSCQTPFLLSFTGVWVLSASLPSPLWEAGGCMVSCPSTS